MKALSELWKAVEDRRIGTTSFFYLSPTHYAIYRDLVTLFKKYVKGLTLDIGAGRLAWKPWIEKLSSGYFSSDIKQGNKALDFISDASYLSVKDNILDTAVCLQVLEHVKNPQGILKDIARALKKDHYGIVSFPHLSYIHGAPEDYFRYTIYGLKSLLPEEFKVELFKESGGIICFIFTPFFIFMHSICSKIPLLRNVAFLFLAAFSVIIFYVDKILGMKKIYPLNYIVVLKKC